jgi:hypothetical protein
VEGWIPLCLLARRTVQNHPSLDERDGHGVMDDALVGINGDEKPHVSCGMNYDGNDTSSMAINKFHSVRTPTVSIYSIHLMSPV